MLVKMYMILATIMNLILAYWSNTNNFTGVFWFNIGCFFWSDAEYPEGKNTIQKYDGDEYDFLSRRGIPYFRDKGNTFIKNRVPENVELIEGEIK